MIITLVRVVGSKRPVLAMAESVSMDELFYHIDEITDPYGCEYKDVEINTRMAFYFEEEDEVTISSLTHEDVMAEMTDDDGWCGFPDIPVDDMTEDNEAALIEGDIF